MADQPAAPAATMVAPAVRRVVTRVFGVSALVFLVTITLGVLNVFTTEALPRWQLLVHLHSATLGWLTLSTFAATVWLFTRDRPVTDAYARRVRWLAVAMIAAFLVLIGSFALAFRQGGAFVTLLAAAAPLAAVTIWAAAAFFIHQLRRVPVVTTPHLLTAAAFGVLALAVVFGTVAALGHAGLLSAPDFVLTGHIFGIMGFQVLVVTGLIEYLTTDGAASRWTRPGALQVALGVFLGLWMPILVLAATLGLPAELIPIVAILGILVGLFGVGVLFFIRVAPQALRQNPVSGGAAGWVWLATLWFGVGVVSFPLRPVLGDPAWWMVFNAHATMVGIVTNLIFGTIAAWTTHHHDRVPVTQRVAMWLLNAGLILFIGLYIATGSAHGALLMATGALIGVAWTLHTLTTTPGPDPAPDTTVHPTKDP